MGFSVCNIINMLGVAFSKRVNKKKGEKMKKVFVILFAFIVVVGLCGGVMAQDMKIGFADKMKILFEYNKTKELNTELEKEGQAARTEVEQRSEEIRKLRDEMELLSESAKKEKQPELEKQVKELNDFRREKMQEIGRKQDEGIRKITEEISAICEQYGKNNGYDAIIDIRATLFAPKGQDLTEAILVELNKAQAE